MPDPAAFWDEKYAGSELHYGEQPNAFLVEQAEALLHPGDLVLVPADGEGRNGVWLAGRGLQVDTVDASPVAVAKASALAERHGVPLRTEVADLRNWDWPEGYYRSVVSVFLHLPPADRPTIHAAMARALAPGGLLILQGFRPEQLQHGSGGPKDPAMLFSELMLREDFAELEILHLSSEQSELDEGPGHQGPAETVSLVARRWAD